MIVLFVTSTAAQQPPARGAGAPAAKDAAPPKSAPVVQFATEGIGVDEALRLTFQNDPNIQRSDATIQFNEGVVQEQRGPFDLTFITNVNTSHRTQELTESRKQSEIDKRTKLDNLIQSNVVAVQNAHQLIPLIDQLKTSAPGQEGTALTQLTAIDSTMGNLVQVFDDLIRNTADVQQKADLTQARANFLQNSLGGDLENGLKDLISTQQDTITARANLGDAPIDENFWDTTISFSLQKLFRNGIQIAPYLDAEDNGTNYRGKPADAVHGGKGDPDLYTLHSGINLTFPLLRGRGAAAVAAFENSAIISRDSSQLQARQQLSSSALATIDAYWDLRAAQETLDITKQTAKLQGDLLNLTRQLIQAGEVAGAEQSRAQAADARARAAVDGAQQQLHQARVALAQAMGVSSNGEDSTLPLAKDPFPATPAGAPQASPLAAAAPSARLDLAAAQKDQEASRVLEKGAQANLAPKLNITAQTYYTALDENNFSRAVSRWVGPSTQVGLDFEKPFGNNTYKGQLTQHQADVRSKDIAAIDLQRQIRLGVVQAASSLPDAIAQVQQAEAAVGFYKSIYDADVERFRSGEGTLIDTTITQQSQTEAALALTAARNALAHLIAQLRFQTGTLVNPDGLVTPQNYTTVPAGTGR
ncbi:MAG TPA: TolC family protein [Vicinamibacterales bacterium]|nr:TolC family protein [Vicinamibacterales bacterium]